MPVKHSAYFVENCFHSAAINQESKLAVHGLKCHLEKCHKDIYTLYTRNVESRQGDKDHLQKGECDVCYQVTFVFVFRPKMNVHFRFRFVFSRKWNFVFVYGRKWNMLFGRPLVYITKRSWS